MTTVQELFNRMFGYIVDEPELQNFFAQLLAKKGTEVLALFNELLAQEGVEFEEIVNSLIANQGDLEAVRKEFEEVEEEVPPAMTKEELLARLSRGSKWMADFFPTLPGEFILVVKDSAPEDFATVQAVLQAAVRAIQQRPEVTETLRQRPAWAYQQLAAAVPPPTAAPPTPPRPPEEVGRVEEIEEEAGPSWLDRIRGIRLPNLRVILAISGVALVLVTALFILTRPGGPPEEEITFEPVARPTATPAAEVTPTPEVKPTATPAVPATATPVPTPTLAPVRKEIASLAAACPEGGYLTYLRFPAAETIGKQGFNTPLMDMKNPVGPKFELRQYRVGEVRGLSGVLLVQTQEGAYFVPLSYFPSQQGETPDCVAVQEVPGFEAALARLTPEKGKTHTIVGSRENWAMASWGLFGLLILAALVESLIKQRVRTLAWIAILFIFTWNIQPKVSAEAQWLLFAITLLVPLALGERGALGELRAVISESAQVGLSREARELLDEGKGLRKLTTQIEWSIAGLWCGINLLWGVLTQSGSPLHVQIGFLPAVGILTLICVVSYLLETIRRNRKGDWGVFIASLVGGVVLTIVTAIVPEGLYQSIAMLITILITILIIILVGLSKMEAIERDRIPDGLAEFASLGLAGILAVVHILH